MTKILVDWRRWFFFGQPWKFTKMLFRACFYRTHRLAFNWPNHSVSTSRSIKATNRDEVENILASSWRKASLTYGNVTLSAFVYSILSHPLYPSPLISLPYPFDISLRHFPSSILTRTINAIVSWIFCLLSNLVTVKHYNFFRRLLLEPSTAWSRQHSAQSWTASEST